MCRQVSSWVGDHQRIPAVDCFVPYFFLSFPTPSPIFSDLFHLEGLIYVALSNRPARKRGSESELSLLETGWLGEGPCVDGVVLLL
jgi:hypothetical protein